MKVSVFLLVAFLVALASPVANAQDVLWVGQFQGVQSVSVLDLAVDGPNNVYAAGEFAGTVDFDPGAGLFELTSTGGSDGFITKLDAAGALVWARDFGGAGSVGVRRVDLHAGDVYATGDFSGTVDFDPGPGVFEMTAGGPTDAFVVKLNAAGNFVWAKQLDGFSHGLALAVDGTGSVYTVGYFLDGTIDFDPGPGMFDLTTIGPGDIYVWKLDSAGDFVWAAQLEGPAAFSEVPHEVRIASNGDVLFAGRFQNAAIDFDPGPGVFLLTPLGRDGFVSRLDSAGNFVWAKSFGSAGNSTTPFGMALDDTSDDVYLTGQCVGPSIDFDPGPGNFALDCVGGSILDMFVSKLDGSGAFQWAATFGSSGFDTGFAVAVDSVGRAHFTGYFGSTLDFDPGPGVFELTSGGLRDAYLLTLDSDGSFVQALHVGRGIDSVTADSIAIGTTDNIHVGGLFGATADFDPGPGTIDLTSAGGADAFVWKYGVPEPEPCDPDPLPQGYWFRQCLGAGMIGPGNRGRGPQGTLEPGFVDVIVPAVDARLQDTVSVSRTCEDGIDATPPSNKCEQALRAYTTLLLNIESGHLQESCSIDLSADGCSSGNIGDLVDELAGLLNLGHTSDCLTVIDCANAANHDQGLVPIAPPPPVLDRIDPIGTFEPVQQEPAP